MKSKHEFAFSPTNTNTRVMTDEQLEGLAERVRTAATFGIEIRDDEEAVFVGGKQLGCVQKIALEIEPGEVHVEFVVGLPGRTQTVRREVDIARIPSGLKIGGTFA